MHIKTIYQIQGVRDPSGPDRAIVDPWHSLGVAILNRALLDLRSRDPALALGALYFWLVDGYEWLDVFLGYKIEPVDIFSLALGVAKNGKRES